MKPLGRHLIADIYRCDRAALDDVAVVREMMLAATAAVGGTRLTDAFHHFEPHGVSGTVVIAESHLSIHTWPEHGYAAVDIFTCGGLDPCRGLEVLRASLSAGEIVCQEVRRGIDVNGGEEARPEHLRLSYHDCAHCRDGRAVACVDPRHSAGAGQSPLPTEREGAPSPSRRAAPPLGLDLERGWYTETSTLGEVPSVMHSLRVERLLCRERSAFQEIVIFDNPDYGRVLVLDGITQLCTRDERIYHEMLVHPAMLTHPVPRRVLVIGGGDGGCLREVLRHDPEEVVLLEIDAQVVAHCRDHLPELSDGAFDDPRVHVRFQDAMIALGDYAGYFDVILVDGSDEVGTSAVLFTDRFYAGVRHALRPGGLCAAQGGAFTDHEALQQTRACLLRHLPSLTTLRATVPCFHSGEHAFFLASADVDPRGPSRDVLEARVEARGLAGTLRYYSVDDPHGS
jgi:spermidine synthase